MSAFSFSEAPTNKHKLSLKMACLLLEWRGMEDCIVNAMHHCKNNNRTIGRVYRTTAKVIDGPGLSPNYLEVRFLLKPRWKFLITTLVFPDLELLTLVRLLRLSTPSSPSSPPIITHGISSVYGSRAPLSRQPSVSGIIHIPLTHWARIPIGSVEIAGAGFCQEGRRTHGKVKGKYRAASALDERMRAWEEDRRAVAARIAELERERNNFLVAQQAAHGAELERQSNTAIAGVSMMRARR